MERKHFADQQRKKNNLKSSRCLYVKYLGGEELWAKQDRSDIYDSNPIK